MSTIGYSVPNSKLRFCLEGRSIASHNVPRLPFFCQIHGRNSLVINPCSKFRYKREKKYIQASEYEGTPKGSTLDAAKQFFSNQFLPICLFIALFSGYNFPECGYTVSKTSLQAFVTTAIFIMAGLSLKQGDAMKAISSVGCLSYGLVTILLVTPLLAPLAAMLPIEPSSLPLGLSIFLSGPTTLSSGISLTQMVGGNVALALLLTITSNMLSVFTLPFMLNFSLGSRMGSVGGATFNPAALLCQLAACVLTPAVIGFAIRSVVPGVASLVDNNRVWMSRLSAMLLSLIPWMQVSNAVTQAGGTLALSSVVAAAACGVVFHTLTIVFNIVMVKRVFHLGGRDRESARGLQAALIIVASQKALPIAITVISQLTAVLGPGAGLAAITCVLSHLGQILVDSMLVAYYGQLVDKW